MTIRAYDEDYLDGAQRVLGDAVDYAVMTLGIEPDLFGDAFSVSDVSRQIARGNPRFVAGMNGCELASEILIETKTEYREQDYVLYLDKSPEYWAGWALAFYQWFSGRSFSDILSVVPLSGIIEMYPAFHEMDILRFAEHMDSRMRAASPGTRLYEHRVNCGLSQSELSKRSGVPLRQIQLFEQRQRDINKTSADTLRRLSSYLFCTMEELMENKPETETQEKHGIREPGVQRDPHTGRSE
ncbi:MAG: helix-turn-helix domain-containing protein [Erysipelotrichaceae bacterium]|nr:helix-turn-helix domain-containing protein [Erysipelotrichaceae bacterium]